jgi:AcrR family transcriptional regulator
VNSRKASTRAVMRELVRERILEVAEALFARHGLAGARMSDIAGAAEVAAGTLYNYFENKHEIVQSLLALRGRRFLAHLEAVPLVAEPPTAAIGQLVQATFSYIDQHRATYSLFVELGGTSEHHIERICGTEAARMYDLYLQKFRQALEPAVRAGAIHPVLSTECLVAYLTGAMNGVCRQWMASGDREPLVRHAPAVISLFLRGSTQR